MSFGVILSSSRRRTLALGLSLLIAFIWSDTRIDPSDDFSLSLGATSRRPESIFHSYRLKEEQVIKKIFQKRLLGVSERQRPLLSMLLAREVSDLSGHLGFDPLFILALISVESSFNVEAVSPVGAHGLLQLMPGTAHFIAKKLGISVRYPSIKRVTADPVLNLRLGMSYLAFLRDKYEGRGAYFLAAYNAGPARLDELLEQPGFRPKLLKSYFHKIRREMSLIRGQYPPELIRRQGRIGLKTQTGSRIRLAKGAVGGV